MVAMYDVEVHFEPIALDPLAQLAELQTRLVRGYEMIDEHCQAGLPVERLEEHWLSLLADYESLHDSLN